MKLAIIVAGAFLLSSCAAEHRGLKATPASPPQRIADVIFQHCIVTARDENGNALSCRCPKVIWATDARSGRATALCTE